MSTKHKEHMRSVLTNFLHELFDGKYGATNLAVEDIDGFFKAADAGDLDELSDYYIYYQSPLMVPEDIGLIELEIFVLYVAKKDRNLSL